MRHIALNAFAALLLIAAASSAHSYTLSGDYFEDQQSRTCSQVLFCTVGFPLPSATTGKLVNLDYVACYGASPAGIVQGYYFVADSADTDNARRRQALTVSGDPATTQGVGRFSFRNAVAYKVTGGPPRYIFVTVAGNSIATIEINCAITGRLSTQ